MKKGLNAAAWFYSQPGFHALVERSGYFTQTELDQRNICPLCKTDVVFGVHTAARLNGKVAHDYCIRTRLNK